MVSAKGLVPDLKLATGAWFGNERYQPRKDRVAGFPGVHDVVDTKGGC